MSYEDILGIFIGFVLASIVGYFFFYRPEKKFEQKEKNFRNRCADKRRTERKYRDWLDDPDWWKR